MNSEKLNYYIIQSVNVYLEEPIVSQTETSLTNGFKFRDTKGFRNFYLYHKYHDQIIDTSINGYM